MELLQTDKEFQELESSFDNTTSSATPRHQEKTERRTDTNCIQTKDSRDGMETNMRQIRGHKLLQYWGVRCKNTITTCLNMLFKLNISFLDTKYLITFSSDLYCVCVLTYIKRSFKGCIKLLKVSTPKCNCVLLSGPNWAQLAPLLVQTFPVKLNIHNWLV